MMVLGLPVVDNHNLTQSCLKSLVETVSDVDAFTVVIIDNGSEVPYSKSELPAARFKVEIVRNPKNYGFYWPLKPLAEAYDAAFMGLCHNDVLFYEPGWDLRMTSAFELDPQLMLIGLCGSDEVDELGGRGAGTMCNFRGFLGQKQENTGRKVQGLEPALVLDSLFMMFRKEAIPWLMIDEKITPCHFYDKIWPMRLVEHGFHVGILDVEIDHLGGQTAVGIQRIDVDFKTWCDEKRVPTNQNAGLALYKEAERRFLSEYRDTKRLIPARVDRNYKVSKTELPERR